MLLHVDSHEVYGGHCFFFGVKKRIAWPQQRGENAINFVASMGTSSSYRQKYDTHMKCWSIKMYIVRVVDIP